MIVLPLDVTKQSSVKCLLKGGEENPTKTNAATASCAKRKASAYRLCLRWSAAPEHHHHNKQSPPEPHGAPVGCPPSERAGSGHRPTDGRA